MTRLVFLDTETTGLDPARHEVWEVAYIIRDPDQPDIEFSGMLPVENLEWADPYALRVGRFWDRYPMTIVGTDTLIVEGAPSLTTLAFARRLVQDIEGAVIVGAVPDFDVRFLSRWLLTRGYPWTAHYHLCDVENLAVGYLAARNTHPDLGGRLVQAITPPWDSAELTRRIGLSMPSDQERHTALGDARWARAIYDRVMGPH